MRLFFMKIDAKSSNNRNYECLSVLAELVDGLQAKLSGQGIISLSGSPNSSIIRMFISSSRFRMGW